MVRQRYSLASKCSLESETSYARMLLYVYKDHRTAAKRKRNFSP